MVQAWEAVIIIIPKRWEGHAPKAMTAFLMGIPGVMINREIVTMME
jgi:hypothetical protein